MNNTPTLTATADVAADLAAVVCQRFAVIGMTCTHCEHAVTTEIGRLAGASMGLSSVFVVSNSLRLRRFRADRTSP